MVKTLVVKFGSVTGIPELYEALAPVRGPPSGVRLFVP